MQQGTVDKRWHDMQPQAKRGTALPAGRLGGDGLVDALDEPKVQRGWLPLFSGAGAQAAGTGTEITVGRRLKWIPEPADFQELDYPFHSLPRCCKRHPERSHDRGFGSPWRQWEALVGSLGRRR